MGRRRSFTEAAGSGALAVSDVASAPTTRVPVAECVARPDNPRPAQGDVAELAASFREAGQIQPATIVSATAYLQQRPEHDDAIGDGSWVVLAGSRRLAAARQAGKDELLVHVADDRVDEVIEVGIIENIQREPLTPVREGYELAQLLERYGTTRTVGEKIGKSHVYVSQRISLTKLVTDLQTAVDNGDLKVEDGRTLAKLPAEEQHDTYRAGPPYQQRSTVQNNGSNPTTEDTAPPEAVTVGNGVSNSGRSSAEGELTRSPSGNAVSKSAAAVGGDGETTPSFGSAVSTPPAASASESSLPADPAELAVAIDREYSAEQRAALLSLLEN